METQIVQVGMALRPSFRTFCAKIGVDYVEHKGLLESVFTITGPPEGVKKVMDIVDEIYHEQADIKAAEIMADAEKKMRRHNRWYRRAYRFIKNR